MLRSFDRHTGEMITGLDVVRQGIEDVITTRLGSRVLQRDYGSKAFYYLGKNNAESIDLIQTISQAVSDEFPEVELKNVGIKREGSKLTARLSFKLDGVSESQNIVLRSI